MAATKRKRAPKITETQEQLAVVAHFRLMKLGEDDGVRWTHIRGERASATDGVRAKKMGVNRAFPDFMFIHDATGHGWIEMKPRGWRAKIARTNNPNEHEAEQLEMHEFLRDAGDWVEICETLDEVKETLRGHGVPLRTESLTTERIKRGFAKVNAEAAAE